MLKSRHRPSRRHSFRQLVAVKTARINCFNFADLFDLFFLNRARGGAVLLHPKNTNERDIQESANVPLNVPLQSNKKLIAGHRKQINDVPLCQL